MGALGSFADALADAVARESKAPHPGGWTPSTESLMRVEVPRKKRGTPKKQPRTSDRQERGEYA